MICIFFVLYKTVRLASMNTFLNESYSAMKTLDVDDLFIIGFLIFSFTFITLLISFLIAQFVTTYRSLMKSNKSHFDIDLVVDIELRSSIATFLGRKLRNWTSIPELTISHSRWNIYQESKSKQIKEIPFVLKKQAKESESNYKQLQFENELVKEEIAEMKLNQEKSLIINLALERKLASLEEKLDQLFNK